MNIFETLRAKSPDKGGEGESLLAHITEALKRAKELYSFIGSISSDITWETFKNPGAREVFFKNLAKAIILHDFGKIDYKFQSRVFTREEKNEPQWDKVKKFFSNNRPHFNRHEILSSIYASFLLDNTEWSRKIMTAIILHHYNNYFTDAFSLPEIIRDFEEEVKEYMNFISDKKDIFQKSYEKLLGEIKQNFLEIRFIQEAVEELKKTEDWSKAEKLFSSYYDDDLSEFTDFYEPKNKLDEQSKHFDEVTYEFLVFLGALRRADYSSSGRVEIEGDNPEEILSFEELTKKFKNKFGVSTLWQEEVLKNKNSEDIKNLILIAPTGSGKTEFSILWSAKNPRKFIYTLPLRVALNDLFMRFKGNNGGEKGYFDKENVDILHSTAFIEHLEESKGRYLDIERKLTSSKLLAYPIMLTTPDQVFLTSLNYYGSDKVLSVYPTSNIVIDEIQTYSPEMAAIIIKTIKTVQLLGGNILVMTATFPPYFEKFLDGFEKIDVSEYKNLTIKNYNLKRHRIEVREKSLFEYREKDKSYEIIIKEGKELDKLLDNKQSVLIVVNNVKKAIELYDYIKNNKDIKSKNNITNDNIFLLHSRIIEKYKSEIINKIKYLLDNNEKVIVVSTQLIEASVDFDFDFMITELSTIDSQIQRWGRVYRKRGQNYQGESPNIVIFAGEANDEIDRGTSFIYDKNVLKATRDILKEYQDKVLSYEEEKRMVEETFQKRINDKSLKEKYERDIGEILDFLNYFSASKKSEAQRIFRKMAGIPAVVPSLMKEDGEDWVKKFAEIIEKGYDISWKEIIEKIKELTGKEIKNYWYLKAKLYEYSVNVPEFALKKYGGYFSKEFRGFRVLSVEKNKVKEIKEGGLDKWLHQLEDDEINIY